MIKYLASLHIVSSNIDILIDRISCCCLDDLAIKTRDDWLTSVLDHDGWYEIVIFRGFIHRLTFLSFVLYKSNVLWQSKPLMSIWVAHNQNSNKIQTCWMYSLVYKRGQCIDNYSQAIWRCHSYYIVCPSVRPSAIKT